MAKPQAQATSLPGQCRVAQQARGAFHALAHDLAGQVWGGSITDAETTLTPVLRSRGEGGVGSWNFGGISNPKLDELAAASSKEPDPKKREQLIKAALKEHNAQVHNLPLHRQVIPWAARSNVEVAHRADNWLEWRWVSVK